MRGSLTTRLTTLSMVGPALVLFVLAQRYIIEGVSRSGLKV